MSSDSPTPAQIKRRRLREDLTQTEAGALIYCALRTWQQWESGDAEMHPAFWELFTLKTTELRKIGEGR